MTNVNKRQAYRKRKRTGNAELNVRTWMRFMNIMVRRDAREKRKGTYKVVVVDFASPVSILSLLRAAGAAE